MRLIGKNKLSGIIGVTPDIDLWISAWVAELSNANWRELNDLKEAFPKAILQYETQFIFPVRASGYCIKVMLCFEKNIALITEVVTNE